MLGELSEESGGGGRGDSGGLDECVGGGGVVLLEASEEDDSVVGHSADSDHGDLYCIDLVLYVQVAVLTLPRFRALFSLNLPI